MNEEEARNAYETEDMFVVLPQTIYPNYLLEESTKAEQKRYASDDAKVLSLSEIKNLILSTLSY
jgi:hypothetical protein